MAIIVQNTPAGAAVGTAGTAANIGADSITNNGAGTITFDADAANGASSLKFVQGTGALFSVWLASIGTAKTDWWLSAELKLSAYATGANHFFRALTGASGNIVIDVGASGNISMRDSANALIKTSTNTIPTNQWVRIEAHVVQAGASSTVQLLYYASANATTATEDMGTTTFTGGANMDQFHYGTITSTPQVPTLRYGNVALGTTKVGPFGTSGGGGGNIPSPWHEYRAFAK